MSHLAFYPLMDPNLHILTNPSYLDKPFIPLQTLHIFTNPSYLKTNPSFLDKPFVLWQVLLCLVDGKQMLRSTDYESLFEITWIESGLFSIKYALATAAINLWEARKHQRRKRQNAWVHRMTGKTMMIRITTWWALSLRQNTLSSLANHCFSKRFVFFRKLLHSAFVWGETKERRA